ncbi:hypothetical protein SAMN02745121_00285 [Nannocystis exedens]|uniref:Uncharacterized protein n=1 Tax=Nannocystis exedens TaxID=54 RepID=A0A1I1SUJ2_9BACT|nr:hypothetical protein [Nannocystis exedens]PCC75744.1 hypothetical protein NAEX_08857 [Nannocystis exedens]SFD50159.1 hypothetical protein SAMN02745121_00285 [Nannocystis exedens]
MSEDPAGPSRGSHRGGPPCALRAPESCIASAGNEADALAGEVDAPLGDAVRELSDSALARGERQGELAGDEVDALAGDVDALVGDAVREPIGSALARSGDERQGELAGDDQREIAGDGGDDVGDGQRELAGHVGELAGDVGDDQGELAGDVGDDQGELAGDAGELTRHASDAEFADRLRADQPDVSNVRASALS